MPITMLGAGMRRHRVWRHIGGGVPRGERVQEKAEVQVSMQKQERDFPLIIANTPATGQQRRPLSVSPSA